MKYDDFGNQIELTDPDAGTIEYTYNALGDLTYQKDNKGNEFWLHYDNFGRLEKRTRDAGGTDIAVQYTYVPDGNGKGQVQSISNDHGITKTYEYDKFDRVKKITEDIQGEAVVKEFDYDDLGRMYKTYYPADDVTVVRVFDSDGYLTQVKVNGQVVWTLNNQTAKEVSYTLGNGLATTRTFDNHGFPDKITTTGGIQDWDYSFNTATGNLNSSTDNIYGNTESFVYDDLDRLKEVWQNSEKVLSLSYDPGNMNIIQKTDAGDFRYDNTGNAGVHAISQLDNSTGLAEDLPNHTITYTDFDKTEKIQEGQKEILFTYGPGQARKKAAYKENSTLLYTRYYSGNYEKTVYSTGDERKIYYINGGDGLAAMYVIENGVSQVYYPHSDYLGNIERVTDASGNLVEEHSYDAWGNRRNPSTWEPITGTGSYLAYRGFTGHEHIDEFGLINMNGRIYDPTLGMFLSPDNNIQAPDIAHNYNRYSYALNNPAIYKDSRGNQAELILFYLGVELLVTASNLIFGEYDDAEGKTWAEKWWNKSFTGTIVDIISSTNTDDYSYIYYKKQDIIRGIGLAEFETYKNKEGDKLLPGIEDEIFLSQIGETCFTTSLEYLSQIFGGNRSSDYYINELFPKEKDQLTYISEGVSFDREKAKESIEMFFNIGSDNIYEAINNNNPVIMALKTHELILDPYSAAEDIYHAVVVCGYNVNDNSLIIVDPETGNLKRVTNPSQVRINYIYEITGEK